MMLLVAMVVLGVIARLNIPVELIPSGFTPPFLYVEVPTLRAAPADVEARVGIPVEERLSTVRNVAELRGRISSTSAGFFLTFRDGTDMDVAYNQVRDRIDRVMPTLDDSVGQYFVWKYDPTDEPIIFFGVSFPEDVNAAWLIDNLIVPRLERQPGVSRVEAYGAPSRVVSIEVDDRLASAAGVGLAGVIDRLSNDNFSLSGGTIEDGGNRLPLRVTSRYDSLAEIASLPVGNGLRLSDIASVEVEDRAEKAVYRINRTPSVFLAVYKESTANTVDVAAAVRTRVDETLATDPRLEGFDAAWFFDQGTLIEGAIDTLEETALWGGLFAIIVLTFFLRRVGMTVLITLAIPASLLMTVVVMYFMGRTLNVLSLTGLMLSVGMVVDNAIVVVESIQSRMLLGDKPREAAVKGTGEVALAVVVATLTTVVVFAPLILMTGNETFSFYLSQIGLPVCVALIASLLISLVFLPLAAAFSLSARQPAEVVVVTWLQDKYAVALAWALRHRVDAMLVGTVALISLFVVRTQVPRTDQSEPNFNDFSVFVEMPDEAGWSERVDTLLAYETAIWDAREALGVENLMVRMGSGRRPQVRAFLVPPEERELSREEIIANASQMLPQFAGVRTSLDWGDSGSATDAMSVRVVGPDSRVLARLAEEAARRMRHVNGVTSVRTEAGDDGGEELHFVVDRERALRLGLSAATVGGTIDFALRGRELERLRTPTEELPILVQGDLSEVDEVSEIVQLRLPSVVSDVVLSDVSTLQRERGWGTIDRENRRTVASITIMSQREDLDVLRGELDQVLDGMDWPRGYSRELGGRFEALEADRRDQNLAVLLAVCFVFLLMGVLFESIVLPFSILLSIPFAFVGVYWALFLTNTSFDMMAGVGVIILIGIVVNNAIVLVDRIGDLRQGGMARAAAVCEAGRQRLRPIVMTAATTIFGLVPMAIGTQSLVGIPYAPLGRAIIGGLAASTVLTLFVVPLFYTLLDDVRGSATRAVRAVILGR